MPTPGVLVSRSDQYPLLLSQVQRGKASIEMLSDTEGRYVLRVLAGAYTVVSNCLGVALRGVPVTVQVGVEKRADGIVGK